MLRIISDQDALTNKIENSLLPLGFLNEYYVALQVTGNKIDPRSIISAKA